MTRERDNRGAGGLLCSYPCKKCNFICAASALVLGCLGLNQVNLNQDRTMARFCMSEYFGFQVPWTSPWFFAKIQRTETGNGLSTTWGEGALS